VAGSLGDSLLRVPDGEIGRELLTAQASVFHEGPYFVTVPSDPAAYAAPPRRARLRQGVRGEDVVFGELGMAAAASRSFVTFVRLREEGRLPAHYRFQVCLPTPLVAVTTFVVPEDAAAVRPAYERRLLEELAEIGRAIPAELLAVQWDAAVELGYLEGVFTGFGRPEGAFDGVVGDLVRLGEAVPAEAELGYHLCYGDAGHKHFVEPADMGLMVDVAGAVAGRIGRPLNWVHMPVPRDRDDDVYLAPLRHRQLRPETEVHLGLVHMRDGLEGGRRRVAAARRVIERFGIATECGFGRRPAWTIAGLLKLHAELSAEESQVPPAHKPS
jgi:hypothetical protein